MSTMAWQAPRTCRDAVEMHRVPLHYTPKDCVQAAESWLRSCKDPLKRSPETPLHHGSEPCPGRAAGSVSAPAGHLKPVLTTPDLVPGLGTVTTVCHAYVRHPGPGPDPSRQAAGQVRKGVKRSKSARTERRHAMNKAWFVGREDHQRSERMEFAGRDAGRAGALQGRSTWRPPSKQRQPGLSHAP